MRKKSITEENTAPQIICTAPWRVKKVVPLPNHKLEVEFLDGTYGQIDILPRIMGNMAGIFQALTDINIFNQVYVLQGVATWPGGIDIAPDALYEEIKQKKIGLN